MTPIVSIIMGSTSDLPVMEKAAQLLNDLHVPFEMNALSAHRTPEAVEEFAKNARSRGITGSNRSNQRGNECSYLGCTDVSFGRYRTCKHFCDLQRRLEKENCKSQ